MAAAPDALQVFVGQDFYVPAVRIRVNAQDLGAVEMNDLMTLSYTDSLSAIDSFEAVFSNWDAEKMRFKYNDLAVFNPFTDTEIWLGYIRDGQDERAKMLTGEITTLSPNFPQGGYPTMTVRGLNLLHRFRNKQQTKPFFNKKDTEIAKTVVAQIAEEVKQKVAGLEVVLDPKDVEQNLPNEQAQPFVLMDNQYPIVFLMERARRLGYELSTEETNSGRKVVFHFRPTNEVTRPTYVLEWGKSMASFQPTLQMANQVAEVTVRGWDPQGKAEIKETATRSDIVGQGVLRPTDALVTEPSLAAKQEVIVSYPVTDKVAAKEFAKKVLRQNAAEMIVAKGRTVGLPALRAGVKVQVLGLGQRFSGPEGQPRSYVVTDTTHTFGDSGYTTDFTARMET